MHPNRGINAGDACTQSHHGPGFFQVTPGLEKLRDPGGCRTDNDGIAVITIALRIDVAVRINHACSLCPASWAVSIARLASAEGYGMIGPQIAATLTHTKEHTSCRDMLLSAPSQPSAVRSARRCAPRRKNRMPSSPR